MNLTTSQCRSVSSGTPLSWAIASAIESFHCSALVMKPSASMSTGASAINVVVIVFSSLGVDWGALLAGGRHRGSDPGDLAAGQQGVPVEPLKHQLAEVIQARLAQKGQADSRGKVARQRLDVVVEVDQQRLVEAGLDEAVRVTVVARVELLAGEEARDVLREHLALEVGDRAGLRGGEVGRVAQREDIRLRRRLERALVGRDE